MAAKWDRSKGRPEPIRALNRVVERENGEPLVDIRLVAPLLRMQRPQVIPYARLRVAEMVRDATQSLPHGYHLALMEAWRPIERQQRIYDHFWNCATEVFPYRTHAALRRSVCRFVAPTDQKAPPGHCTGGAVDVCLVREDDEPYDMSSPMSRMQSAPTYSYGLTEEAAHNRTILIDAMLGVGFSNCRDEWWHYSFGDAGWAVRIGRSECRYGLARLDRELYAELEMEHIEAMKVRPNPFKN